MKLPFMTMAFALPMLANAQRKAMTIQEYRALHGTSIDSTYRSAIDADSTKAVFGSRTDEVIAAWQVYWNELGGFLRDSGFVWELDTRCLARVYFNAEGGVDHFLYSFRAGTLDEVRQQEFDRLLNEFVAGHSIALKAAEPFSQCGPAVFSASK